MIEDDCAHDCAHEYAVSWNPFNRVTQCHRCGEIVNRTPSRIAIAVINWQSRWWALEEWALRRLFRLHLCHSCSGYFRAPSMMTPDYPDKCEQCFAREWELVPAETRKEWGW